MHPLERFHPLIVRWFSERFGEPTEVQRLAWPRIAAGEHVLAVAPTGSGKTLAAFLWTLDRLLSGAWPGGRVRVLYVSPLRALGNDVRRNLLGPLEEIQGRFASAGEHVPELRVAVRTGDTPATERARMARRPPEILITTPETLNILLTSRAGRVMLSGVATVILDEVHALAGTKRGAHLITGVERLVRIAGEFQRIALSATVRPLERVAAWIGGGRAVAVLASREPKRYELSVGFARAPFAREDDPSRASEAFWDALADELRKPLRRNRSTLIFANSKRMVEKLTRLLNRDEAEMLVYSHHGALAREVRVVVEERLKRGELRGIVATSSLELGIDIGSLDEVVLAQTPHGVASATQRIGRAGHAVGGVSRARFLPFVPRDLLQAAVTARAVLDGAIEPVRPVAAPLDVLAQTILSMVATETWKIDELHATLRAADPFRDLGRRPFDLTLEMLAGRYAAARLRPLRPLLSIDRVDGTVHGLPGLERLVYRSGGTIPDRGYLHLRREGSGALLGELDEEFVWERKVGDAFTLGVQSWRIERITHNDVFVTPVGGSGAMAPFWRAEEQGRGFELSERVGRFLEEADAALDDPAFLRRLETDHCLEPDAARALVAFLSEGKAALGGALPHRHSVVAESVVDPLGKAGQTQVVLHTFWGGRVNRPLAMALAAALEERYGVPIETLHDDDCVALSSSAALDPNGLLQLVSSSTLERLVSERLEGSGFFGARFREAAGISLLLPREGFRRRTPLWLARQRAKELLEAVAKWSDFPLRLEAWRACLADAFDLQALRVVLDEIAEGRIELRAVTTSRPSPFAAGVVWRRTNELMYEDDARRPGRVAAPRADLLREVVFTAHLRPRIAPSMAETLRRKLQRTWPGYAPSSAEELLDWLEERVVLSRAEWIELLAATERDHGAEREVLLREMGEKAVAVRFPGAVDAIVVALQALPRILHALSLAPGSVTLESPVLDASSAETSRKTLERLWRDAPTSTQESSESDPLSELIAEWLRFHGPIDPSLPERLLGLAPASVAEALEGLASAQRVVVDRLTDDAPDLEVCDAENLEILLRMARAGARPAFEARPIHALPLFLASWQRVGEEGAGASALEQALDRLFGHAAPAQAWETEILPARLPGYLPAWLDAVLAETDLLWFGCGERRIAFALGADRELFAEVVEAPDLEDEILPQGPGRFTFEDLIARSGLPTAELSRLLWGQVWKGDATNDGFAAVRRGLPSGFEPAEILAAGPAAPRRRLRFDRWRSTRPFAGSWYRLPRPEPAADPLDREERNKDRARVLLERYGVVFRELIERELPALRWKAVFRALRLLELAGEVLAGQFFRDVPGLQFAARPAFDRLAAGLDEERVWWVAAIDPASPCGLGLRGLPERLPRRAPGNHLVFHGTRLVVVSERRGRRLEIAAPADHPLLPAYLGFLRSMLGRAVSPVSSVVVETINGAPAADGPWRDVLAGLFHVVRDGGALRLSRRY